MSKVPIINFIDKHSFMKNNIDLDNNGKIETIIGLIKRVKQLEEIKRIYEIQIIAARKAQSLGLCKKALIHAVNDVKALEER